MNWHVVGVSGLAAMIAVMTVATAVDDRLTGRTALWAAAAWAATALAFVVVRDRKEVTVRLVWPLLCLAVLFSFRLIHPSTAQLVTGFLTLIALYSGLSQPPWRALIPVPFSLLVLYSILQLPPETAGIRIVISAVTLTAVSELPARLMAQLSRNQSALARSSELDPLTGVLNRRLLPILLREYDQHAHVAMLDLDYFKVHNDTHGHLVGDQTLSNFAEMLKTHCRTTDFVIRFGGEEFVVILVNTDAAASLRTVERWAGAWKEASGMTFSAGIAELNGPETLSRADKALYQAKADGRDRAVLAPPVPNAKTTVERAADAHRGRLIPSGKRWLPPPRSAPGTTPQANGANEIRRA
jgi:diguanylate cyclase (GGDEF)-like protein